jgi:hypothetical protein
MFSEGVFLVPLLNAGEYHKRAKLTARCLGPSTLMRAFCRRVQWIGFMGRERPGSDRRMQMQGRTGGVEGKFYQPETQFPFGVGRLNFVNLYSIPTEMAKFKSNCEND